jgi:hypothetical protein
VQDDLSTGQVLAMTYGWTASPVDTLADAPQSRATGRRAA